MKESIMLEQSMPANLSSIQSAIGNAIARNDKALNEANGSSDVEAYKSMLRAVIERTESSTVLPYISSYVQATTPEGKIPVILVKYVGKDESKVNVTILNVASSASFTEGGVISSPAATGNVLHVEADLVLVETLTGTWVPGVNLDNAIPYVAAETTLIKSISNVVKAGTILRQYGGEYDVADAEIMTATQKNKFRAELKFINYKARTKTIHTGFTLEALQDILAVYKDGKEKLISAFTNIITQEVEQDYIEWLKTIATPASDCVLTASLGMQSGIRDTYTDILGKINAAIGRIRQNTSIDGDWYTITAPQTTQALRTIDLVTNTETQLVNSKYMGKHLTGGFTMVEDNYALNEYVIVGHSGIKGYDSGGALFIPYNIDVVEVVNPTTLQTEIGIKVRYDYVRSPLDTQTTASASDFFEMFQVTGYDALPNF